MSGGGASQAASAGWGTGAALGAAVEAGQPPVDQRYSAKTVEDLLSLVLRVVQSQGEGGWGGEGGVQDGDGGGRGDLDCGRPQRCERCHAARCSMVPGAVIRSPLNLSLSSSNSWR